MTRATFTSGAVGVEQNTAILMCKKACVCHENLVRHGVYCQGVSAVVSGILSNMGAIESGCYALFRGGRVSSGGDSALGIFFAGIAVISTMLSVAICQETSQVIV